MASSPWQSISRPERKGQLSALRIAPDHPHEIFRTRDHSGACGFSIAFKGPVELDGALPRLKGFSLWAGGEPFQLRLTLQSEGDLELFQVLSEDLARSCLLMGCSQEAFNCVLGRLRQWQKLLAQDRSGLLTDQEVRGLIGELTFLELELLPRYGDKAVAFWNGPERAPQDFAIGSTVFEIKTRTGSGPAKVRISSPEQLWPSLPLMFLCVYYLAENSPGGRSLGQIVQSVRSQVAGSPFKAILEQKLEAVGYLDLPEYDEHAFLATPVETYLVRDGFPVIAPSAVPGGVSGVSYDLSLDYCRPFSEGIQWPTTEDAQHV